MRPITSLLLLLFAACPSGPNGPDGGADGGTSATDAGTPVSSQDALAQFAVAACDKRIACGWALASHRAFCVAAQRRAAAVFDKPTFTFEAARLAECLARTANTPCEDVTQRTFSILGTCLPFAVLRSTGLAPGAQCGGQNDGACQLDHECRSASCGKTCQPLPGVGAACLNGSCAGAALCDAGTCVARLPAGASCTLAQFCQVNGACSDCAPGTSCVGGRCVAGVLNAPCSDALGCVEGVCDEVTRRCEPAGVDALADGAPCTGHALRCRGVCVGAVRATSQSAGVLGQCVTPAVGASCTTGTCPRGSACVLGGGEFGTCRATSTGSPCSDDFECPAGAHCHETASQRVCRPRATAELDVCQLSTGIGALNRAAVGGVLDPCLRGTCLAQPDGGARCEPYSDLGGPCGACKWPGVCVNGRCERGGLLGGPCALGGCEDGGCTLSDAGVPICAATRETTCVSDGECRSGRCYVGTGGGQCAPVCN